MTYTVSMSNEAIQKNRRASLQENKKTTETLISQNGKGGLFSTAQKIPELLDNETKITQYQSFISVANDLSEKTEKKLECIQSIHHLMSDFKDELMFMRSDTQRPKNTFSDRMNNILEQVSSIMNAQHSLSGTSEIYGEKVVDFSLLTNAPSSNTPDYSYALGGDTQTNLHIDLSQAFWDLSSLTAKDPMFEEFIRAVRIAQTGDVNDKADPAFENALTLINSALVHANDKLQDTAFLKKTIDEHVKIMENQKHRLEERNETISGHDITELLIKSALNEEQLESLFYMFARSEKSSQEYRRIIHQLI